MKKELYKLSREIIERIRKRDIETKKDLRTAKKELSSKFGLEGIPSNADIMKFVPKDERQDFSSILGIKPSRSISGVSNIAVMWNQEESCPGNCVYCPRGDDAPQSYTGKEPAARRAKKVCYDPYKQVKRRLKQLELTGHSTEKSNLIIMGGTFPAAPWSYQKKFVRRCFDAFNKETSGSLKEAQKKNETTGIRNTGITIETRPDFAKREHIDRMLSLGATRVEIGVQTLKDETHELTNRKHKVEDSINATKFLKNSSFKVAYHMMIGMPGESREYDVEKFKELFSNPKFMPDELKIYPTEVIEGTELYEWWKKGDYEPLSEEEAKEILIDIKKEIPPWVRIKRIMRDIPSDEVDAGPARTNMRQLIRQEMEEKGERCRCIRCREAGHVKKKKGEEPEDVELVKREYKASEGKEIFLSYEDTDKDIILAYLRLRFPGQSFREEIDNRTSLVRELKVVGPSIPLNAHEEKALQHKGLGTKLLKKAEEISSENDFDKILVISGVGVREYYRNHSYERDGPYMSKEL